MAQNNLYTHYILLSPALAISVASSAYITSGCLQIPLLGIDIIDAVADLSLNPPISKMDIAPVPYLNASIISSPPTPLTRSSAAVAAVSVTISTLATEIKSIYYPPPN